MSSSIDQRSSARGFTKPPILGVSFTVARIVVVTIVSITWGSVAAGRLNPILVALPALMVSAMAFTTIYHVSVTRWALRWWTWRRHAAQLASWRPARDVTIGDVAIGVVSEHEALITLIELHPDPLAPSIVTDRDERTVNAISLVELDRVLRQVLDAKVASADLLSVGYRAVGWFASLYQQIVGPTVAAAERRSWIVVRMGMQDNMAAIGRRGGQDGAQRLAAATCLRIADALASDGVDARPATAAAIDTLNALLHTEAPTADHWSYLESQNTYTGVYYADPASIANDAAQWWTWPQSRDVTSLVRLTPTSGETQIAALVRYRTNAATPAPPVSGLGPLYGIQSAVWPQFRVGCLPCDARLPSTLLAGADHALAFGPSGPLLGLVGDPRDRTSVHLPLAGPITVLCQTSPLLRQVALRACVTGRPVTVVTNKPQQWTPIIEHAVAGAVLGDMPDAETLPDSTILVIDTDADWPMETPRLTILTSDEACDADIELVDPDDQFSFILRTRKNLRARVRSVPAHEERRILGVGAQPAPERIRAGRNTIAASGAPQTNPTSATTASRPSAAPAVTPAGESVTEALEFSSVNRPAGTNSDPATEVINLSKLNPIAAANRRTSPPYVLPNSAPPPRPQQPARAWVARQQRTPARQVPPPKPSVELDWAAMADKPSRKSAKPAGANEAILASPRRVRLSGTESGRHRAFDSHTPAPQPHRRLRPRRDPVPFPPPPGPRRRPEDR